MSSRTSTSTSSSSFTSSRGRNFYPSAKTRRMLSRQQHPQPHSLSSSSSSTTKITSSEDGNNTNTHHAEKLEKLKVSELRERLAVRKLKVSGKKQELIARLLREEELDLSEEGKEAVDSVPSPPKQQHQQQQQQQQPVEKATANNANNNGVIKRNVMNGKASPASFATEDLRLELDIAKDREDGKGFTGLEITWLGTSSGAPTFSRNVSATAVRTKDEVWLFDCGEATQHQMMRCGVKLSKISRIFITHMHGDHIFGLPGLLCAISACRSETYKQKDEKKKRNGNNGRGPRDAFKDQEPLVITGPPGLKAFVHAAMTYSRTQLGTDIIVTELTTPSREKFEKCNGKVPAHVAVNEDCAWKKRGNLVFGDCWPQEGMNHVGFPRYKAREWEEENRHAWPSWVVLADENVCIRAAPLLKSAEKKMKPFTLTFFYMVLWFANLVKFQKRYFLFNEQY